MTVDEYGTFGKKIVGYDPRRTADLNVLICGDSKPCSEEEHQKTAGPKSEL